MSCILYSKKQVIDELQKCLDSSVPSKCLYVLSRTFDEYVSIWDIPTCNTLKMHAFGLRGMFYFCSSTFTASGMCFQPIFFLPRKLKPNMLETFKAGVITYIATIGIPKVQDFFLHNNMMIILSCLANL